MSFKGISYTESTHSLMPGQMMTTSLKKFNLYFMTQLSCIFIEIFIQMWFRGYHLSKSQHWFRQWLYAVRHLVMTGTNHNQNHWCHIAMLGTPDISWLEKIVFQNGYSQNAGILVVLVWISPEIPTNIDINTQGNTLICGKFHILV